MTCVLSLILARALHDQTFMNRYSSLAQLLDRARYCDTDYVPLKWKPEMSSETIFTLSYDCYSRHFQNIVLAAGY